MSDKWGRMALRQEAPSSPTIVFELPGGAQGTFSFVPPELASELVKRWNAYEDRTAIPPLEPTEDAISASLKCVAARDAAIPPREPTNAMLAAPWRKMIENYPTWQPTDVERSNMRYGWIAMYDAAIAEKDGK